MTSYNMQRKTRNLGDHLTILTPAMIHISQEVFFSSMKMCIDICVYVLYLVTQSCPSLWIPKELWGSSQGFCLGIFQAKIMEWVAMPSFRGSSHPRDGTQISHISCGFFTTEPPGKPKNTGIGSLSLLQGTFVTQELNRSLLHCSSLPAKLPGKPICVYSTYLYSI